MWSTVKSTYMTPLPILLKIKHLATKGIRSKSATRTRHRPHTQAGQPSQALFASHFSREDFLKRFASGSTPLTGNLSDPSHTAPSELCKCRENWGRGPWQLIGLGMNSQLAGFSAVLVCTDALIGSDSWIPVRKQTFDYLYNYFTCPSALCTPNHEQRILIHDPWPKAPWTGAINIQMIAWWDNISMLFGPHPTNAKASKNGC